MLEVCVTTDEECLLDNFTKKGKDTIEKSEENDLKTCFWESTDNFRIM